MLKKDGYILYDVYMTTRIGHAVFESNISSVHPIRKEGGTFKEKLAISWSYPFEYVAYSSCNEAVMSARHTLPVSAFPRYSETRGPPKHLTSGFALSTSRT
ncbi:uncharacterized protein ARMOST_18845 [Armillaria ostoyae]|uniref:Uncharacterized protein n=1 Tax=Armillaria ostoyae TaxID=47428 RepID=A0A284S2W4_ARMOS|nr:uncharacterized protein ARMOST_18845 [Armillaria ostoyae]